MQTGNHTNIRFYGRGRVATYPHCLCRSKTGATSYLMERDFEKDSDTFKELFVHNWKHKANRRRYTEVGIRNEFYNYIHRILTTDDNHFGCVTTYVNNVLEQHFRNCKEAIDKYLEMNNPFKKMR